MSDGKQGSKPLLLPSLQFQNHVLCLLRTEACTIIVDLHQHLGRCHSVPERYHLQSCSSVVPSKGHFLTGADSLYAAWCEIGRVDPRVMGCWCSYSVVKWVPGSNKNTSQDSMLVDQTLHARRWWCWLRAEGRKGKPIPQIYIHS